MYSFYPTIYIYTYECVRMCVRVCVSYDGKGTKLTVVDDSV